MRKILFVAVSVLGIISTCLAATDSVDIYSLAQSKNVTELNNIDDIDIVDSDGNTALCVAIKNDDIDTYNVLKTVGANTGHKCVKNIPAKQYEKFITKVASANKSWSFLGLGKWAWAAIGAGVAGGAVAAGMGGGGGSGSSGTTEEPCADYLYTDSSQCPAGYTIGSSCQSGDITKYKCDMTVTCPYTNTSCGAGFHTTGNTCQSGNTIYVECAANACAGYDYVEGDTCPDGWTMGASCLAGTITKYQCNWVATCPYNTTECTGGYVETGETCQSGYILYKECTPRTCSYDTTECTGRYEETGNTCLSGETLYKECREKTCAAHATLTDTGCVCEPGYMAYVEGIGCQKLFTVSNSMYTEIDGIYVANIENHTDDHIRIGLGGAGALVGNSLTTSKNYQLTVLNEGNGNIYGISGKIASASFEMIPSGTNLTQSNTTDGTFKIINNGDGDIYGLNSAYNTYTYANPYPRTQVIPKTTGNLQIQNEGSGDIYGMYSSNTMYNSYFYAYLDSTNNYVVNEATITVDNVGDGDIYGMYSTSSGGIYNAYTHVDLYRPTSHAGDSVGRIEITNEGNGDVYGIYAENAPVYNAYTDSGYYTNVGASTNRTRGDSSGYITINNIGDGNVFGIYGKDNDIYNKYCYFLFSDNSYYCDGDAIINIYNNGSGNTYGIYSDSGNVNNHDMNYVSGTEQINLYTDGTGNVFGMYGTNGSTIKNTGTINIRNVGTGMTFGMFGDVGSTIINSGSIYIRRQYYNDPDGITHNPTGSAGYTFGIYARANSSVYNTHIISIDSTGDIYGIYAEPGSTVSNTGSIFLNGDSCFGASCNMGHYIVLNGSTLYNSGLMMAPQMNLNSFGGNVTAGLGAQFVVENELSGDLNISSELVQNGNQTTYIAENMINAGDVSGLNVSSGSAMFDASLADNGHDVVMQMKDFESLTDNKSLAAFLADNYANGNGMDLFATLKSMENMSAFNGALSGMTGLNAFTQFAHEDLSAMREISFSMNNKLFENSGRDSFDISDSLGYFSFSSSNNSGSGQYGISSDRISDNWKIGYGMATANINSRDGDGFSRQNNMWLFYVPATYTNDGYELVVASKAGFANSEYSRRGYNNINYEGYIEKRIFGLMNDLRYPLTFGNWTFAPDVAFNTVVYTQSGHEEEQEFSLVIPDDKTISIEAGLGLYTKYEKTFESGSRLKLNSGLMAYREFGDTYDIKLGIRGMDGTFSLYNNDYEYRGAASFGFDYMAGRLRLYGNAQYFMDNANYMNFKSGISYRF